MDCQEAIYSNDYYDIIVNRTDRVELDHICSQMVANRYAVYYLERSLVPPLSVGTYKYINIPKCYTILDQGALEASGITRVQNQRYLQLKGNGILIGFLDTGERVMIMPVSKNPVKIRGSADLVLRKNAAGHVDLAVGQACFMKKSIRN